MRRYVPMAATALLAIAVSARGAEKAAPAPISAWPNPGAVPMAAEARNPPKDALMVQLGRDGRPYRILTPLQTQDGWRVDAPPRSEVQLWDREAVADQPNNPFATAARWHAVPRIVVGPPLPLDEATGPDRMPPAWSILSGAYRAFPEGNIPVTVYVSNTGAGAWNRPRVRLFAPEGWTVTPEVAEVVSEARTAPRENAPSITQGRRGVLPPTMTGAAHFTVRIPKRTMVPSTAPLVAFLRFEAGRQPITVQNSVDVRVVEPIDRRYAMNEQGTRFLVHLQNRFAPMILGTPAVEVRRPTGADWEVRAPEPVEVGRNVDAVAPVTMPDTQRLPHDQVAVPVVVTLNGYRMGYTPTVHAVARYGAGVDGRAAERGLTHRPDLGPAQITDAGLCPASGEEPRTLAFDVTDRFAVSEPREFMSPTWVTVTLQNRGATRIRLEYDAWGFEAPVVAADQPLSASAGAQRLTFLLPDARFRPPTPNRAGLVLFTFGGDVCIESIAASKWKP